MPAPTTTPTTPVSLGDPEHSTQVSEGRDLPGVPLAHDAGGSERAWREGTLLLAGRRADALVGDPEAPTDQRVRAAAVLAAVLAHRGLLAQSAALHAWIASVAPRSATGIGGGRARGRRQRSACSARMARTVGVADLICHALHKVPFTSGMIRIAA